VTGCAYFRSTSLQFDQRDRKRGIATGPSTAPPPSQPGTYGSQNSAGNTNVWRKRRPDGKDFANGTPGNNELGALTNDFTAMRVKPGFRVHSLSRCDSSSFGRADPEAAVEPEQARSEG
jgi:hypothetical protein